MLLEIEGPASLTGEIQVSGAKNAALPCLFATLLSDDTSTLSNVPEVVDILTASKVLENLGCKTETRAGQLEVKASDESHIDIEAGLARSMRASILALGPLLAKRGEAKVPLPGGCDFGERPIDIHLWGLKKMGAKVEMEDDVLHASADGLVGAELTLAFPTFTGTENLMMAATLAKGRTTIRNAGREPEIADLARMLRGMGANITGVGTETIVIDGVQSLSGASHRVMPDRIEACTYLAAAVATGGQVTLTGTGENVSEAAHSHLRESGAEVDVAKDSIEISMEKRPRAMSIMTEPYPGFPTDLQAQFMAVDCVASGTATIVENVWANRFRTAAELRKLGADITVEGNKATINGVESLQGGQVVATDLRASAALVIAGLCAHGTTIICDARHLQRGYADLPGKLRNLGAKINLVEDDFDSGKVQVSQGR